MNRLEHCSLLADIRSRSQSKPADQTGAKIGDYVAIQILEHEDVDSVSGLVLAELGRTPVVGDIVEWGRLRVEVLDVRGKGVGLARVTLIKSEP